MPTEGRHHSEYDPALAHVVLGEAAHLLRNLGFAAQHAVLIGGVVPMLLILDPGAGRPRHLGTADIDLCLSIALIEGDTGEYERIEQSLRKAGYEPTDQSFRWRRKDRGLDVEFFCPASPERPAGQLHRPKQAENPRAKLNLGANLSAMALDAGTIIGEDVVEVEREVDLPDGGGWTTFTFRLTGVLAFLVAKVSALTNRDKPKDAYDIVWLIENWERGPEGAAAAIRASAAFARDDSAAALARLWGAFSDPDRLGPASFVRFMADESMGADERIRLARQAVGVVRALQRALAAM
ncbi:MAG: nucleotidyl transferase AbiEii/AbiGii toxin family protein [Acidobacteria bacterium]|nr:nucleotidyl transferase AbiEii/AbiGii toxin family protein [Acidobacteriota bacterium]